MGARRRRLWWLGVGVFTVVLAMLLRFPLSVHLDALPMDPNSPLHALAARQLADFGSPLHLAMLDWPAGVPVRMVAWPTLLIAAPLVGLVGALPALNLATTVIMALQGVACALAASLWGAPRRGQLVAAAAGVACPYVVHAQGLGRQENLAFLAFALVAVAATQSGWRFGVAVVGALAIAAFSSPYQAVPTGVMLVLVVGVRSWRALGAVLGASAGVGALVVLYYVDAALGDSAVAGITTSPPETQGAAVAAVGELLTPRALSHGVPFTYPSAGERLSRLTAELPLRDFGPSWGVKAATQVCWIGTVLLLAGGIGLALRLRAARAWPWVAAGLVCVVFALGPDLRMWSEQPSAIPLPWALTAGVPGLDQMVATHRFMSGAIFVLCLGAGWLAGRLHVAFAPALIALLVADTTLRAPAEWPLEGARSRLGELAGVLPGGPIALYPPVRTVPAQNFELAAAALGVPVGLFVPDREAPAAWVRRLEAAGAVAFVELWRDEKHGIATNTGARISTEILEDGGHRVLLHQPTCLGTLCWRAMVLGHREDPP